MNELKFYLLFSSGEIVYRWITKRQILMHVKGGEGSGDAQVMFICCSESACTFCAKCCVLELILTWHVLELWAVLLPTSDIVCAGTRHRASCPALKQVPLPLLHPVTQQLCLGRKRGIHWRSTAAKQRGCPHLTRSKANRGQGNDLVQMKWERAF